MPERDDAFSPLAQISPIIQGPNPAGNRAQDFMILEMAVDSYGQMNVPIPHCMQAEFKALRLGLRRSRSSQLIIHPSLSRWNTTRVRLPRITQRHGDTKRR